MTQAQQMMMFRSIKDILPHNLNLYFQCLSMQNQEGAVQVLNGLNSLVIGFQDPEYKMEVEKIGHNINSSDFRFNLTPDEKDQLIQKKMQDALFGLIHRVLDEGVEYVDVHLGSDFIGEISSLLQDGFGQNIAITGKTGSGKSYSALAIGEQLAKLTNIKFELATSLTFDVATFTKRIYDLPENSLIIFDEAGVGYGARDFQSKRNKCMNIILQTVRFKKMCLVFTVPDLSFIDIQLRKMLHYWIETDSVNKKAGYSIVRPHGADVNQMTGEIWFPRLKYNKNILKALKVIKPTEQICIEYEKVSQEFKTKTGTDIVEALEQLSKEPTKKKTQVEEKAAKYIEAQYDDALEHHDTKIDTFKSLKKAYEIQHQKTPHLSQ